MESENDKTEKGAKGRLMITTTYAFQFSALELEKEDEEGTKRLTDRMVITTTYASIFSVVETGKEEKGTKKGNH